MKDYSQILTKITTTPWMMHPNSLKLMLDIFEAHLSGNINHDEIRTRLQNSRPNSRQTEVKRTGMVGVMPLYGPIFPKANMMTELSGATSLESWRQDFRQMVDDDSIMSIVLDIDSPGGSSSLVEEVGAEIRAARDVKPIHAISNTMAASAAYWLAAQATKLYGSPSSLTGNVGTYIVHTDESGLMESLGVKETVVKAGRFKAVEIESLTPEGREYLQEIVNDHHERFVAAVAEGRGTTTDAIKSTEAKIFGADRALREGIIDDIATFEEVLSEAIGGGGQNATVAVTRSVSVVPERRASYDADKEHSEPGTGLGGEPTPREPPEEGDKAIEGGWRRDPPPVAYEEVEEAVNREWLEARATSLGIEFTGEMKDEDLANLVAQKTDAIVVPLAAATREAEKRRRFAEDYPEESERLQRLETNERVESAQKFAEGYARFEGSNKGFSNLVRSKIEESHAKISTRQFGHEDLKELLDTVSSGEAVVQWGEVGSSVVDETTGAVAVTGDFAKDRKAFADLVLKAMTDDHLDEDAAIAHVSQQHPDLARAYASGHVK